MGQNHAHIAFHDFGVSWREIEEFMNLEKNLLLEFHWM